MKKIYTSKEIETLSKNPCVKIIRQNRLSLTYEFRLKLWGIWETGGSVQEELARNGLTRNILTSDFIMHAIGIFKKYGCPRNGKSGVSTNLNPNTNEEIKILLDSGFFEKGRNGISFSSDFVNKIYHEYPEHSIEKTISSYGIDPRIVGYQRIYLLKKSFDSNGLQQGENVYTTSTIELLKSHPYIKRISTKQIVFREQFYQEAYVLKDLHIDRILKVFEIDHEQLPIQLKNRLKRKINHSKKKLCPSLNSHDLDMLIRVEHNKQEAMVEMIESGFAQCKSCIPYLSKQNRKALCEMISKLPKDEERNYTIRTILKKIGISKTSYYAILQDETYGQNELVREEQDKRDIGLIKEVIAYRGYPKGSRDIIMMMPRLTGQVFGRSKVLRLLRKAKIICPIRKANINKRAGKEMVEKNTKPNWLNRQFRLERPLVNTLTDVSYIKYGDNRTAYLSAAKDASSGRILAFVVSEHNDESMIDRTLQELKKIDLSEYGLIHSDQGTLYLSQHYQDQVKELGLIQSMSRRGNCWDNASQESFFGHFKDECTYQDYTDFKDVESEISSYMQYYNEERPQWTRNKMTPIEFEEYLLMMSEEEFAVYVGIEKQKYDKMVKSAEAKAKKRAIEIGARA